MLSLGKNQVLIRFFKHLRGWPSISNFGYHSIVNITYSLRSNVGPVIGRMPHIWMLLGWFELYKICNKLMPIFFWFTLSSLSKSHNFFGGCLNTTYLMKFLLQWYPSHIMVATHDNFFSLSFIYLIFFKCTQTLCLNYLYSFLGISFKTSGCWFARAVFWNLNFVNVVNMAVLLFLSFLWTLALCSHYHRHHQAPKLYNWGRQHEFYISIQSDPGNPNYFYKFI